MFDNFVICVNAVVPSAIYLAIGIIIRLSRVVSAEDVKSFTRLCFLALYPFMMFDNLYGKDLGSYMDGKLVLYAVVFVLLQFALSWLVVCLLEKENRNRGTMIQAIFRSNVVLMGLPIAVNIIGKENATPVAIVILFAVTLYNVLAVIVLEVFRGGRIDIKGLLKDIITNPIILGGLAACCFMLLGIDLPEAVHRTVITLSDATAPIAMILLGASLSLGSIKADRRQLAISLVGKLLISPLLGIGGALLMGFSGAELLAIVLMVATPTALASYAMASSMGGNGELAGECVVFSTLISCVTIPLWLFVLMNGGYL